MTCPECETRNAQVLPGYGECQTCLKARMVAIIETESASKGARELDDIRVRDAAMDQPGEQEFAAIAFIDRRRLLKRHDALLAQVEGLREFVADYITAEETALIQWEKDYPRLPWKPDHDAMKRLERARAALAGTDKENRP